MSGKPVYAVVNGQKQCRDCQRWLDLACYAIKRRAGKAYYQGSCKRCQNIRDNEYYQRNPEVFRSAARRSYRQRMARNPNWNRDRYRMRLAQKFARVLKEVTW